MVIFLEDEEGIKIKVDYNSEFNRELKSKIEYGHIRWNNPYWEFTLKYKDLVIKLLYDYYGWIHPDEMNRRLKEIK